MSNKFTHRYGLPDVHFDSKSAPDRELVRNHHLRSSDIDKLLDSDNEEVRQEAIQNPNATTEHISKALDMTGDKWGDVRYDAIKNRNATTEHLNKGMNDDQWWIRELVVRHPKATKELVERGLNDTDDVVRATARRIKKERNL
jgi:hypothetical protein